MGDWKDRYFKILKFDYAFEHQLKLTINKVNEEAKANHLNAVDTLILVDKEIMMLLTDLSKVDASRVIVRFVICTRKPFAGAAEEEITQEVFRIKKEDPSKENSYFEKLKEKGFDLDGTEILKIEREGRLELEIERKREEELEGGDNKFPRLQKKDIIKARRKYLSYPSSSSTSSSSFQDDTQFPTPGRFPYHTY